jgi:Holliday junction DNA helicase RuvA
MIAHITGTIIGRNDKSLIIQTAGIGYRVLVTAETILKHLQSGEISLWTSHIVREDSEELFGFETESDQELFELLLSVSGIGPRSALGVMNVATRGTIARAVAHNDVSYLTKISGIGKKTAEKIILELRDKLSDLETDVTNDSSHDVIDALIALGYLESQSREVVRGIDASLDTQTKIREALKKI